MPHLRPRHLESLVRKFGSVSPLVGILGHRQAGKTTLLSQIAHSYVSMDDLEQRKLAEQNPKAFLALRHSLHSAIDECQLVPELFPALKERVRQDKRPGQFYLSGSVRFTSKEAIRESLTGRILNTELLPLTVSELARAPLPETLQALVRNQDFRFSDISTISKGDERTRRKALDLYEEQGGLPGICFLRTPELRRIKLLDQLETILSRDLQQVSHVRVPASEIFGFVRELAKSELSPVDYTHLQRVTGISPATQKKLIYALEATFVIRLIKRESERTSFSIYFEDQGELQTLAGQGGLSADSLWQGLVLRNLREQWMYRVDKAVELFQFTTRGGIFVPFAVKTQGVFLGVLPILGAEPSRKDRAAARSFLAKYMPSKFIFVTKEGHGQFIDARTAVISATQLLFE